MIIQQRNEKAERQLRVSTGQLTAGVICLLSLGPMPGPPRASVPLQLARTYAPLFQAPARSSCYVGCRKSVINLRGIRRNRSSAVMATRSSLKKWRASRCMCCRVS